MLPMLQTMLIFDDICKYFNAGKARLAGSQGQGT